MLHLKAKQHLTNKSKNLKRIILIIGLVAFVLILFYTFHSFSLPKNHGKVYAHLFLGDSSNQPLIVAFGGSEGGNVMASDDLKQTREQFLQRGYAFLAMEYFGTENTPSTLDRISLNAIYDTIKRVSNHPKVNKDRIILYGGSRGAELVLNLASRYKDIDAVIALVPSNVSLPSKFGWGETSSWTFHDEEVPYISASKESLQLIRESDFYKGFSKMLENEQAVNQAAIKVERINCPILLLSATEDEVWPSYLMSNQIIERLKVNKFPHYYKHIALPGGHAEPAKHPDIMFEFLETYINNQSKSR